MSSGLVSDGKGNWVDAQGNKMLGQASVLPAGEPLLRATLYTTPEAQGELVEAVADLLDNALHLEDCYIGPDNTECVCVIGKIRAVLPRCPETRTPMGYPETPGVPRYWRCGRTVHPSRPHAHAFGEA